MAGPMVLAAGSLRIPAAITEADAHLGLANRLAVPFAKRVLLSYPIAGREGTKYRVVGRPIPRRSLVTVDSAEARRRFDLPPDGAVVLVCGGSLGARRLNEAAIEAFGEEGPAVLHLAGERDYPDLADLVGRAGYRLLPFTDDFGAALAAADVVVSRAGGAVWEIAAAGRPALLVPYPEATADHQTKNARWFERGGGSSRRRRAGPRPPKPGDGAPGGARSPRRDGRGDAEARPPGSRDDRRRGADRACSRSPVGISGSSGSAAPA